MGIFPADILFSCGFNYKELCRMLEENNLKDWLKAVKQNKELIQNVGWCAIRTTVKSNGAKTPFFLIISTELFDFSDNSYCILAHESLHICQYALPDFIDRTQELEAEAYLHSHIMGQCLANIRLKK